MLRRQPKLERFLPKAFSGQGTTGWRAENASSKGSRLDLFRFVPFRLNRLAAEVSAALSGEYQQRYRLHISDLRLLAMPGLRHHWWNAQYISHCTPNPPTPLSPSV